MIFLFIAILVVIDQATKYWIIRFVDINEKIPVIEDFFSITHVRNSGGAFSFLAEHGWGLYFLAFMSLFISVVLLVIIYRIRNKDMFWIRLAASVLAGGSIGNMIDRFVHRSVVDFLRFDFGKYTFPIFNFADMCIVIGSITLALFLLFDKRMMRSEEEKTDDNLSANKDSVFVSSENTLDTTGTER